ncbi:MAG TPA: hypothetical protein VNS61_18430 [Caldimonas sp.]|jgi:hypothetical protein|nr:hypothetical protein [Caldimonas sp.]
MKATPRALFAGALLGLGAFANAADPTPAPPRESPVEASAAADRAANEPIVKRTVIDDSRARIEELRVRGQLQKVTVAPKGNVPSYEVLTGDGSRDLTEGSIPSRGSPGKRVWNVLSF